MTSPSIEYALYVGSCSAFCPDVGSPLTSGSSRRAVKRDRRDHLEQPLLRRREEHLELLDVRVEPRLAEAREDPLGVVLVVRRADVVRTGAQALERFAHAGRLGNRPELALPITFCLGCIRGVAGERRVRCGRRRPAGEHRDREDQRCAAQSGSFPRCSHKEERVESRKVRRDKNNDKATARARR